MVPGRAPAITVPRRKVPSPFPRTSVRLVVGSVTTRSTCPSPSTSAAAIPLRAAQRSAGRRPYSARARPSTALVEPRGDVRDYAGRLAPAARVKSAPHAAEHAWREAFRARSRAVPGNLGGKHFSPRCAQVSPTSTAPSWLGSPRPASAEIVPSFVGRSRCTCRGHPWCKPARA